MKPTVKNSIIRGLFVLALAMAVEAIAAGVPAEWAREQSFTVAVGGLVKISLPVETLDSARPGLEDLRLFDDAGQETPYLVEHPAPVPKAAQNVKSFRLALSSATTVVVLETGLVQPLDTVILETPESGFIKAARIEGSSDGHQWRVIAEGEAIFNLPGGARRLGVPISPGVWAWLRLTLDDQRSPPVAFTGAQVQAATVEPAPSEWFSAEIVERHENPGESRLVLGLDAANLDIVAVRIDTPEALFTRRVTLSSSQMVQEAIREQVVGEGVVYRVAVEGQPASENLAAPVGRVIRSRELLLSVRNLDSPPLAIKSARVERRPVYLVFLAGKAGAFRLMTGNSRCSAPRYDLAGLGLNLKAAPLAAIQLPSPRDNPDFRPSEALPGVGVDGATLDVAAWKYRKPLKIDRGGAQQLELDLDILSGAEADFRDIRLSRRGRQIPYVLEQTSILRAITPEVVATNDARDPAVSRWILKLPRARLPLARLLCEASADVFERSVTLSEEAADERGAQYRRGLGQAVWVSKPGRGSRQFSLALDGPTQTDTVFLETRNGDNRPIGLEKFQLLYPVSRLVFKANAGDPIFAYYGNSSAPFPRYDLSLVADEMLAAKRTPVASGAPELLKSSFLGERDSGKGGALFWGVLALVVIVLLVIVSRLLPKPIGTTS